VLPGPGGPMWDPEGPMTGPRGLMKGPVVTPVAAAPNLNPARYPFSSAT